MCMSHSHHCFVAGHATFRCRVSANGLTLPVTGAEVFDCSTNDTCNGSFTQVSSPAIPSATDEAVEMLDILFNNTRSTSH